jgi:hypothetical protein
LIKLTLPKEPYWLDLGLGVRIKVRPCTSAIFYQARARMNQRLQALGEQWRQSKEAGLNTDNLPNLDDESTREALAEQYLTLGLAEAAILEWEGVLEADGDAIAQVESQNIRDLFDAYWMIAERFRQQYTGMRELLDAEKNASGPESSGTSETGPSTADAAKSKTYPAPEGKPMTNASAALTSKTN